MLNKDVKKSTNCDVFCELPRSLSSSSAVTNPQLAKVTGLVNARIKIFVLCMQMASETKALSLDTIK